jgi:hypothetical protein
MSFSLSFSREQNLVRDFCFYLYVFRERSSSVTARFIARSVELELKG